MKTWTEAIEYLDNSDVDVVEMKHSKDNDYVYGIMKFNSDTYRSYYLVEKQPFTGRWEYYANIAKFDDYTISVFKWFFNSHKIAFDIHISEVEFVTQQEEVGA